jgi:ubiquinone/menaquinone biosynthesis C-methylase UbiE
MAGENQINMNQHLKDTFRYCLLKTLGASAFARWLEWRKLLKWLNLQKGEKILDIACGDGELSLRMAAKGAEVYGLDMSAKGIASAKRLAAIAKIKCEFTVGDAERLPYADRYFDGLICSSSLEHFISDARSLSEMNRVLKPGGRAVLTVDSFTYPINPELKERHRKMCAVEHYYTREDMSVALRNAGLAMSRNEYLLTSGMTSFFIKFWIKHNRLNNLFILITFLSPLMLLSENLSGKKDRGYTLIVEAVKAEQFQPNSIKVE